MEKLGSSKGSPTHPAKAQRLAAIASGWMNACKKDPDCSLETEPDAEIPQLDTPDAPQSEAPTDESPPERKNRAILHQ
jgi:hypothetical protein